MSAQQTYVDFALGGVSPVCACGCGETPKFYTISVGFAKFRPGHASRVSNNWGHNARAQEKSLETRREMWQNGELTSWTKGLSKETDERIAALAKKQSLSIQLNPEKRRQLSERMRKNRLSGVIPTLTGSAHSQWRGGTSSLAATCHGHSKLFAEWKYPKLRAASFRCTECESQRELEVHHDGERMAEIVKRFADQIGYDGTDATQHLKHEVASAVADYHVSASVSGVVLCSACHDARHARAS